MSDLKQKYAEYKKKFESVKNRIDVLKIAEIYEQETGNKINKHNQGICPFCGSGSGKNRNSTPAFTIYPAKNFAICYSCNRSTNIIDLIMHVNNLDYKQAIHYIAKNYFGEYLENPYEEINFPIVKRKFKPRQKPTKAEIQKEEEDRRRKFQYLIELTEKSSKDNAKKYLAGRGIDIEKLPDTAYYEHPAYKDLPAGVVFFDNSKKILNKRYVTNDLPEGIAKSFNFGYLKNTIYDAVFEPKSEVVYITEGVINALSFHTIGKNAIALFSTSNIIDDIDKFRKYFEEKHVVIAADFDKAGQKAAFKWALFILENYKVKNLKFLLFPGGKDANDLLQEKQLQDHCNNKRNFFEFSKEYMFAELDKISKNKDYMPNSEYLNYIYNKSDISIEFEFKRTNEDYFKIIGIDKELAEANNIIPVEYIQFWQDGYIHHWISTAEFPIFIISENKKKIIWRPNTYIYNELELMQNALIGLTSLESEIQKIKSEQEANKIANETAK